MITYVDASVLAKLVVDEVGSREAAVIWDQADVLVACKIGYVEVRAALAAARRARRLNPGRHREAVAGVDDLWNQISVVEVSDDLVLKAAELVELHGLRGDDAVHLAAALLVGADVFLSADLELRNAAAAAGLHVANPIDRSDPTD